MEQVGSAGQPGRADGLGLPHHRGQLVLGDVEELLLHGVGHGRQDDEVAQPLQRVLDEAARRQTALHHLVDGREDGCAVACGERVDDVIEEGVGRDAEELRRALAGHALGAGAGEHLVEDRQPVTSAPCSRTHDERHHRRVHRDALGGEHLLEQRGEIASRHQAEGVVVGARLDGAEDLLRLRRREHEAQELRRLLDELQQRVERRRRHHVRLVDDVDLVAARDGGVERALPEVTRVVDAVVGGRVDLDDVEGAGAVGRQADAAVADAAGVGRRALLAVERPGEDAGAARLAAPARAAEQVGVVDLAVEQRLAQWAGHVLLALDLRERARSVLAVQRQRHPRSSYVKDPSRTRSEPACPCCLPALGGFSERSAARGVSPHPRGTTDNAGRGRRARRCANLVGGGFA